MKPEKPAAVTWEAVCRYLPIVITMATILLSLGGLLPRLVEAERDIADLKAGAKAHEATFLEIQVSLARVETQLTGMEKELALIRSSLQNIAKEGQ